MENDKEQEGLLTGKKALAGAAVGIAVAAEVTAAKQLLGGDNNGEEHQEQQGQKGQKGQQSRQSSGSRSSGSGQGSGRSGRGGRSGAEGRSGGASAVPRRR